MQSFISFVLVTLALLGGCGGSGSSVCPNNQPCVHYVSDPGVGGNGASDGGAAIDLAAATTDLAMSHPADQSTPLADLANAANDLAAMCLGTGGSCPNHNDAICCSHYCVYATNSCR